VYVQDRLHLKTINCQTHSSHILYENAILSISSLQGFMIRVAGVDK
jgi:hypothetical protein